MFERRITLIVSVLLIAVVAVGALGYGVGRFVTPPEEITTTTTTTTTTTQVSTSLVTVTERLTTTTTSTVSRAMLLPQTFPAPANSSAVIRSFYLFNGSVLATLSVDKPVYSQGDTVHIKATLTNLTPDYLTLDFYSYLFDILNSSRDIVWTHPEYMWNAGIGPPPETQIVIPPGETKTGGEWSTADWNMKGLHFAKGGGPVYYDDHFVPEGQYTLMWDANIHNRSNDKYDQPYLQTISFTITKPK